MWESWMARDPSRPTIWVRTAMRALCRREAGPELPSWVAAFQIYREHSDHAVDFRDARQQLKAAVEDSAGLCFHNCHRIWAQTRETKEELHPRGAGENHRAEKGGKSQHLAGKSKFGGNH
ncbi:MAG: hypothetical protein FRX49_13281 [Trebouxia sp. A1-2]|nr:MAG: hypothetical protein FRX49_13281 [Trebouxia sp. A1-2]